MMLTFWRATGKTAYHNGGDVSFKHSPSLLCLMWTNLDSFIMGFGKCSVQFEKVKIQQKGSWHKCKYQSITNTTKGASVIKIWKWIRCIKGGIILTTMRYNPENPVYGFTFRILHILQQPTQHLWSSLVARKNYQLKSIGITWRNIPH